MGTILYYLRKAIPKPILALVLPPYHYTFALAGALWYGFPSRKIKIVAVTGTKGKSTTTELVNAILEQSGMKTAMTGTIRFKIGDESRPNKFKMTMPGRMFLQKFLSDAVEAGCDWAIVETTSEGIKQYRHKFIDFDALIFTNIAPEHIESHGSFEKYLAAKLMLKDALAHSKKRNRVSVANVDDKNGELFLNAPGALPLPYSLKDAEPYKLRENGSTFTLEGVAINTPLVGVFNVQNMLAAATFARSQGIDMRTIKIALENLKPILGRVERVEAGQNFTVIVDYAHTPDSLEKLYQAFPGRKVCLLGNTGGGRDKWKRPLMGQIADTYCEEVILANEDPYDENPKTIMEEMAEGIKKHKPEIILDRRKAIRRAISLAKEGDTVLITGKGTDPYIMGPRNSKTPWSDSAVAKEEIVKHLKKEKRGTSYTP